MDTQRAEVFQQTDTVRRNMDVLSAVDTVVEQGNEMLNGCGIEFAPENFQTKRIQELDVQKIGNRKGLALSNYDAVDLLRSALAYIEFQKRTRVEIDHHRPSRSARTVSEALCPFDCTAVSRWSSQTSTSRGRGGAITAAGRPRFRTSNDSPLRTCCSISVQ